MAGREKESMEQIIAKVVWAQGPGLQWPHPEPVWPVGVVTYDEIIEAHYPGGAVAFDNDTCEPGDEPAQYHKFTRFVAETYRKVTVTWDGGQPYTQGCREGYCAW